MPKDSTQALSPELSDVQSPESLYHKDDGLLTGDQDALLSKILQDASPPLSSEVLRHEQEPESGQPALSTNFPFTSESPVEGFESLGKLEGVCSLGAEDLLQELGMQLKDEEDSVSSYSPELSPVATLSSLGNQCGGPRDFEVDDTQVSLCEKSRALQLQDETYVTVDSNSIMSIMNEISQEALLPSPPPRDEPRKARKTSGMDDAPNSMAAKVTKSPAPPPFDAGSAVSSSEFIFTQFGQPGQSVFTFSGAGTQTSTVVSTRPSSDLIQNSMESPVTLVVPRRKLPEPSLNLSFPAKANKMELKILVQPEDNHRARYMTEGSRGAVKDKSQQDFPSVRLIGYNKPATLQVFIGTDTGKVKPHGFYQACRVCGKTSSSCTEKDVDGTTVIEIPLSPKEDMTARIDCVGILKLRNADVEKRIGLARSKKKSTRVRLVFRVNMMKPEGSYQTLQVTSTPISCTQPAGQPEICKKSLTEAPVTGGQELFIIGKNFMKGTKVIFQVVNDSQVSWAQNAVIDMEYFQPNHLICKVPAYRDQNITEPVTAQVMVQSSGRTSEPHGFMYCPVQKQVDDDVTMEAPVSTPKQTCVSPEAVALNQEYMKSSKIGGQPKPTTDRPEEVVNTIQSVQSLNAVPAGTVVTPVIQSFQQVLVQEGTGKPMTLLLTGAPTQVQQAVSQNTTAPTTTVIPILPQQPAASKPAARTVATSVTQQQLSSLANSTLLSLLTSGTSAITAPEVKQEVKPLVQQSTVKQELLKLQGAPGVCGRVFVAGCKDPRRAHEANPIKEEGGGIQLTLDNMGPLPMFTADDVDFLENFSLAS